jgi:prepilin-type N-terminal cleavage/methylation domain-containing protein
MSAHKGLTLVELMIVIALIFIVCAIAAPPYFGYALNTNLKSAARDIQSDFLSLKQRAVSESTTYRITFDVTTNTYTIEKGTESGSPFVPLTVKTPKSFGGDIGVQNVDFSGGSPAIVFQERGIASNGKVVLINSRGSTAAVITSVSGRAYVQLNLQ